MVYQLAKTSPLLTGQVKMNMIMNGAQVVDLQYVPISNYIPFNYDSPEDVLNYKHGDNIKTLYRKISDQFFSEVHNPKLSPEQLHRYEELCDDTHENTYEMGMKRLEYQRYNKQFEFFCPFWCDNIAEFNNISFVINLAIGKDGNTRAMFSKKITFSDKIDEYLKNIYPSLGFDTNNPINTDLVYISFNEMQSHINGINAENGTIQTVDTSYLVNNLIYQERPVLETDNMIVSLFGSNKIICDQIFNFNFVFNIEDFVPIYMLNDVLCERINVYVDMYIGNDKVPVKDIYSNYEFIPKYDIAKAQYSDKDNVLDYLSDYKAVELITKNKLTQGTFHWVLQNNQKSIFNLYNGFAPVNDGQLCTAISNDAPDMFTDVFDLDKNPFGIFKYTYRDDIYSTTDFVNHIDNTDSYFALDFSKLNDKEFTFFGNILLENDLLKKISYKDLNYNGIIQVGITKVQSSLTFERAQAFITEGWNIIKIHDGDGHISEYNYVITHEETVEDTTILKIMFFVRNIDEVIKNVLSFNALYSKTFSYQSTTAGIEEKEYFNMLNFIASIIKCTKMPSDILFNRSIYCQKANSPSYKSKEVELCKADKFAEVYRYDTNIMPFFIDLNDKTFKNRTYWCKQYNKTILNTINNSANDPDDIATYSMFALKKFTPLFESIDYYALKSNYVAYDKFYLDGQSKYDYAKEKSWYKNNSMIYLPNEFIITTTKSTGYNFTEDDIVGFIMQKLTNETDGVTEQLVRYYIKDLYQYKYKYDYVSLMDINNQKYEIKFTLK